MKSILFNEWKTYYSGINYFNHDKKKNKNKNWKILRCKEVKNGAGIWTQTAWYQIQSLVLHYELINKMAS